MLCDIYINMGENALCETCKRFPRITLDYSQFQEKILSLACPEALRLLNTMIAAKGENRQLSPSQYAMLYVARAGVEKDFIPAYTNAVQKLLEQLTNRPVKLTETTLKEIISQENTHLFFLLADQEIAGMLTVGIYHSPTGGKAWIEDVVMDEKNRGTGEYRREYCHDRKRLAEPFSGILREMEYAKQRQ